MKRKLLPLAISAAVAVPGVAMAEPTVYGRADIAFENIDTKASTNADSQDAWEVNSKASRLGVKGKEKLNDSLSAIYKMEFEVGMAGDEDLFKRRNNYVGLASDNMGQILLGTIDTPLKIAQQKVDIFSDHNADIKNFMSGEERLGNSVNYVSPKIADSITVRVSLYPGEGGNDADGNRADGIADGTALSVAYEADGLYAALAINSEVQGDSPAAGITDVMMDTTRLVGAYKMDNITIGGIYQMAELSQSGADGEETALFLSGSIASGSNVFKASYGASEAESGSTTVEEITQFALGVDHKFSKKTKVYAELTSRDYDKSGKEHTSFGVGIQQKF